MQISVTLDEMDFDLELDVTPGYYIPANLDGHPDTWTDSEGEDHEFDIESAYPSALEFPANFKKWKGLDQEEKDWINGVIMKANQLKHNIYSEEDREIILEAISEELK